MVRILVVPALNSGGVSVWGLLLLAVDRNGDSYEIHRNVNQLGYQRILQRYTSL